MKNEKAVKSAHETANRLASQLPDPRKKENIERAKVIGQKFYGYQPLFALLSIEDIQKLLVVIGKKYPEIYAIIAMVQNRVTVDIILKQIEEGKVDYSKF